MLFSIFVKRIIFFIVAFQCIVPYYIPDDVIKHQTTWHDTSRITITEILTFHWINNRATCQGNSFYGGNNSLPNGGNVFILFFGIEWRQPSNSEKRSLIDVQCDLYPYESSNGFSSAQILQQYENIWVNNLRCVWNNIGYHINTLFWSLIQFVVRFFEWSCPHCPTYKLTGVYS